MGNHLMSGSDKIRRRYLGKLYEMTEANVDAYVAMEEIQRELGLTDDAERKTRRYLDRKHLVEQAGQMVQITASGIQEVEDNLPGDIDQETVQKRQDLRWEYLETVYEKTDGDLMAMVMFESIHEEMGIEDDLGYSIQSYLSQVGVVSPETMNHLSLTSHGLDLVESEISS